MPVRRAWRTFTGRTRVLLASAAALAVVAAGSGYAMVRSGGMATRDYPAASLAGPLFAGPAGVKAQAGQGISQGMSRIASFGGTAVAVGSQTGGNIPRAQFFVSHDDGTTWKLAAVTAPGGGPAPGHAAQLIAHGRAGWLATGPDGIWTSASGQSWTLASTAGITPADAGDQPKVLTSTGSGFLAAGQNTAEGTAVIWTSADGLHWQRMTAPQLRMPARSGTVADITGVAARGGDILLSGHIVTTTVQGHGAGSQTVVTRTPAAWLSTDGGVTWTLAPVPVSHGASNGLAGIAAAGTGFVAIRPGTSSPGPNTQPDGVVFASADGASWQYVSTLTAPGGLQIGMVTGGPGGFAALGRGPGGNMAVTLSADGLSWRSVISFGPPPASVTGATVTAGGSVIVTGARGTAGSQRPYFALAQPGQAARAVNVAAIPGATVSQLSVNAVAVYGSQRVAVGEASGRPAVWSATGGGSWSSGSWSSPYGSGPGIPSTSGPSGTPAASGSPGTSASSGTPAARGSPGTSASGSPGNGSSMPAASAASGTASSGLIAAADGQRLTSVVHGPAGWLATGEAVSGQDQQPIIATSADGMAWNIAAGTVLAGSQAVAVQAAAGPAGYVVAGTVLAGSQAVAVQAAAGPAGYVVAGTVTTSAGAFPAAWWSRDLRTWHRAGGSASGGAARHDPGEMLGVTAGSSGFTAVGREGISPAAWTSRDGRTWAMETLKVPAGTASAELQHVAVSGQHAVALGQEISPSGARTAFAEVSADGGRTWRPVSLPSPRGAAMVTAVTPMRGGFTAVGTYGTPGDRDVIVWTSADGSGWTVQTPNGTGLSGHGVQQITGLTASGGTLAGVGFTATEAGEQPTVWNVSPS